MQWAGTKREGIARPPAAARDAFQHAFDRHRLLAVAAAYLREIVTAPAAPAGVTHSGVL